MQLSDLLAQATADGFCVSFSRSNLDAVVVRVERLESTGKRAVQEFLVSHQELRMARIDLLQFHVQQILSGWESKLAQLGRAS